MADESQNSRSLMDLLLPYRAEGEVLKDALAEIASEDRESRKTKAKELLRKAIELDGQMKKARADFAKQSAKWDKELGGLLRRIEAMKDGREPEQEVEPAQG